MLTADMVAAGIHFFADDPPGSIARKALRVNLSDLAAKGADPFGYLLSLALPAGLDRCLAEALRRRPRRRPEGVRHRASRGDTTRAAGGLTIAITALGRVPKGQMVLRSGAKPGDAIFVSGTIGDGALGLRVRTGALSGKARGGEAPPRPLSASRAAHRARPRSCAGTPPPPWTSPTASSATSRTSATCPASAPR
ncbi:MAG: AIR synthase related protein [Bauldia sp.]